MAFFTEVGKKKDSKIYVDLQEILNSQSNYGKEDKTGGFTLLDFKLYYKAINQNGISIETEI